MIQTLTNFISNFINNGHLILIFILLIYIFITLHLTYFIYNALTTKKNKITYFRYISLIKDKDFIFFKDSLFKVYGYISIILFILLFKNEGLIYLLQLNNYYLFFLILFIYSILLSNWFILLLFKVYLNFKYCINILNDINFYYLNKIFNSALFSVNTQGYSSRSFSTSTKLNSNFFEVDNVDEFELDSQIENLTNDEVIKGLSSDPEFRKKYLDYQKNKPNAKVLKDFKKAYGGGYLGYSEYHNLANVSQFYSASQLLLYYIDNLISKLQIYVNEIPENVTYSVLPVLRWQISGGSYRSFSITESIKITRNTSLKLLAELILFNIQKTLRDYSIRDQDLELYLMGRPWLSVDEFELDRFLDRLKLDDLFNDEIEKKISSYSKSLNATDYTDYKDKISNMKNYLYQDIIMNNYGYPILDKNNNLLGYQLDENKFITVDTSYNKDNLLCNKVSIRGFQDLQGPFKGEAFINWIDIKTENGFIREFKIFYSKIKKISNFKDYFNKDFFMGN